jgi:hypothetical protein
MSQIQVQLVFEGSAVDEGRIDAGALAQSLAGYSGLFRRANAVINGEASEAAVLVESNFKPGSFVVNLQFDQHLIEAATTFITHHQFLTAASLASVIGLIKRTEWGETLIDVWKWLKGKKPDEVTQTGNNTEITLGANKKKVSSVVYNLYGDSAIRAALDQAIEPLRREGFNRMAVREDNLEQLAINKEEAESFATDTWEPEPASTPTEGERDALLIVSKLAFTERSTWSFFDEGATVVATIEDEAFWQRVHNHEISFGEGDRLRVRLHWKVESKNGKLKQKNRIIKVNQVFDRPKQLRLDGGEDESELRRPIRRIVLDDEDES